MINQVFVILFLAAVATCAPDDYHHKSPSYSAPSKYHFDYSVHDDYKNNHFGHSESRDGYGTKGHYFVYLPDGRRQDVHYTADKYGYYPVVTYTGEARHPSTYGHGHSSHGHSTHGHSKHGHGYH